MCPLDKKFSSKFPGVYLDWQTPEKAVEQNVIISTKSPNVNNVNKILKFNFWNEELSLWDIQKCLLLTFIVTMFQTLYSPAIFSFLSYLNFWEFQIELFIQSIWVDFSRFTLHIQGYQLFSIELENDSLPQGLNLGILGKHSNNFYPLGFYLEDPKSSDYDFIIFTADIKNHKYFCNIVIFKQWSRFDFFELMTNC